MPEDKDNQTTDTQTPDEAAGASAPGAAGGDSPVQDGQDARQGDGGRASSGVGEAMGRSSEDYTEPRFFEDAMRARARALGKEYQPYRPPKYMTEKLSLLDEIAKREQGGNSTMEGLHTEAKRKPEDEKSLSDESRFYRQAQHIIQSHNRPAVAKKTIARNNFRALMVIFVGIAAYYIYASQLRDSQIDDVASLKESLPLQLDEGTVIQRVEETPEEFLMYIVKQRSIYEGLSEGEIEDRLQDMARVAPGQLCRIPAMNHMVKEGRKLTVSLSTDDGQIEKVFSIDRCNIEL